MKKITISLLVFIVFISGSAFAKKGRKKQALKKLVSKGTICQVLPGKPNITVCVDGESSFPNLGRERLTEVKALANQLTQKLNKKTVSKFTVTDPYYPSYDESTYTEDTSTDTDLADTNYYDYMTGDTSTDTDLADTNYYDYMTDSTYEYTTTSFEDDPDAYCAETVNEHSDKCLCYLADPTNPSCASESEGTNTFDTCYAHFMLYGTCTGAAADCSLVDMCQL